MGNYNVIISGSRCRGLESKNSDIDIVVEYKGSEHEDTLFNAFNEDGLTVGGVKVDINPITEGTESYQDTTIDIVSGRLQIWKSLNMYRTFPMIRKQSKLEKRAVVVTTL